MKYGLVIYGKITKPNDWNLLNETVKLWKSKRLNNGHSFFVTSSISLNNGVMDSALLEQIDKEVDGSCSAFIGSDNKELSIKDIQKCMHFGLKNCKEAGMMQTLVLNYNFCVGNIDDVLKSGNLCCASFYKNKSVEFKTLVPMFMCGKTKTLQRVWEDAPTVLSLNIEEHTFRAFANVAGNTLSLMTVVSPESISLTRNIN